MTPFRVLAVVVLAGSVLAAAFAITHRDTPQGARSPDMAGAADPLNAVLRRCQTLGPGAQDDAACREAWRKNRERFFRSGPSRQERDIDRFPVTPSLRPPVPLPPQESPSVPE